MRSLLITISIILSVSCKSTSGSFPARSSFVVPANEEDGNLDEIDDSPTLRDSTHCGSKGDSLLCVRFVKNDDAKSIVVELPPHHAQAGKLFTVYLSGIEPLEMKATERCERKAAQKAKHRVTEALLSANRIDVLKLVEVKAQALRADVQVDGHSLSAMLQDEKLVRPLGAKGKADWCQSL